jgi:elongation factor G
MMEVVTPGAFLGSVIGDLSSRRAQIKNIEGDDNIQRVQALIPLSEVFGYATVLRSMTQGRAAHTMEFKHYQPVPTNLLDTVVRSG